MGSLFFWRAPLAIAEFVVSVWVGPTIKRFPKRSLAHIGKEVFETGFPSFTNSDASSSVEVEVSMFGLVAAGFHRKPAFVGSSSNALSIRMGVSVFFRAIVSEVRAAATSCVAGFERISFGYDPGSTITLAKKLRPAVFRGDEGRNDEAAKTKAGDILDGGHPIFYIGYVLDVKP